ncbi:MULTISPECIES: glycosyltransferase family 1 protein [unclassified Massilia]|uniref:glycosyltransferase family 4 protein n=1 Tax=unclassified Massilia TaxID=2609279 RepID=UPI00178001CE|nr:MULTISPECIES: glycosyltransferase family 1 protein [unclassified Massilia]MBD8532247.1 glycosyltransferase family 1 protein [Massilia sp. CFBP 13647]MBD8675678.1 glycosyltransferase family 1 protein [Massilia sp. CFBP 13721]
MHLVDITMFYAAESNGVSTYLNAKARWLARHGRVQHTILSPNVDSGGAAPALVRMPAVALPGINGFRMPTSVRAPVRLLRQARPDLIEAGDAGHSAWAALRLRRRLGVPAIAFYHSDLPRLVRPRFGQTAESATCKYLAHLYRQFDLVLAPSRAMVEQLHAMGVPDAHHQPLGIDSGVFSPARRVETLRAHLRLPENARLLVYAGRFTHEKKLPLLIEAVRKLGRPYHLLMIGGGLDLPRYPQITYLPFKRNQRHLARLLASCDVLVHPGDCETFGLIVLEAMACGLPVVATTRGGVAELIDEHTGILAQPNCVDSLASAIEAAYGRDLGAMGAHARRKAAEYYDWNEILPQVMRRYQAVLGTRGLDEPGARSICVTD